jgi:8-amino-7-oxononanoate synthase
MEHGVYVNLVLPPAAPEGAALLRCSLSAAHSFDQIDAIIAAFKTVAPEAATRTAQSTAAQ